MSIQQIQTKNLLDFIAKSFFVNGINPTSHQLYSHLSNFFSQQPAGLPMTLDKDLFIRNEIADEDTLNDFLAVLIVNLDTLYEVCAQHIDELLMLNTLLRTHLDRLKIKRKVLEHKIDDYLLGIYNSDGYFYSSSDSFADTSNVDLFFSSIFIDTLSTTAMIPSVSSLSSNVPASMISDPNITILDADGNSVSWQVKSNFANAIDGMTNTAWYIECKTEKPTTLTATIDIVLSSTSEARITKIDVTPYGVTEVQCGINAMFISDDNTMYTSEFCNYVKTSTDKMIFVGDQITDRMSRATIQLSKTTPDYINNEVGSKQYMYIFGFKELLFTEQVYDPSAILVTNPISIPEELKNEAVIDAVSLVTEDYIPTDTNIIYYIASNNDSAQSITDFNWRQITPLRAENRNSNVVSFEGAASHARMIRKIKRTNTDLQMIDLNSTNTDLSKRNPTPSYIPGIDIYRIVEFKDEFLSGTLKLEEGINTTRIFYTEYNENAINNDFAFWRTIFDDKLYTLAYGEIDSGHEYFYGADVGENNKSVYVETFLEVDKEYPVFLKECRKSDINSQLWNVRLFLNGREIAKMPVGINKLTVPWKLKQGLNHVVMMVNIPEATLTFPSPYIGTFNIMTDANLFDYGVVKLDNWAYVDYHKMINNQVNQPNSFTLYNNEIISRKQPTNNFKISYKKSSSAGPTSVRLRADLSRTTQLASATPIIDAYRLRFSYK